MDHCEVLISIYAISIFPDEATQNEEKKVRAKLQVKETA
jgi:hypothetical protein